MNIVHKLAAWVAAPCPPPPGGFRDDLPEAFAALDAGGRVMVIGYLGEWYEPLKPTLRVRLHNWLIRVGDRPHSDHVHHAAIDDALLDARALPQIEPDWKPPRWAHKVGDVLTHHMPGFKPKEFRVTSAKPSPRGFEVTYELEPVDGDPRWERIGNADTPAERD